MYKNKMPNIIKTMYNYFYQLEFEIFEISTEIQYIIETNPVTNIKKIYWITTQLDLLQQYLN